jgi:membrane-bound lytic murein transglycosylase B
MQKPMKLAVGAIGGAVVAAGVVVITASAAGVNLVGAHPPAPAASPSPAATPPASARKTPNPAARAVTQATLQAEAQALGLQPADLTKDLRQGMTLHQVADRQGVSRADFQTKFDADLKTILDQDVQQGTLTDKQEQAALKRLGGVPNWDTAPGRRPSPSPSASASP